MKVFIGNDTTNFKFKLDDKLNKIVIHENSNIEETIILSVSKAKANLDLVCKKNSKVKIILDLKTKSKAVKEYNFNLQLEENVNIKYLLICSASNKDTIINQKAIVDKNANLELLGGFISDDLKAHVKADLIGQGARVDIKSVTVSSLNHNQVLDVYLHHMAKDSIGNMTNIAICNKNGFITLNGVEKIDKGMKNSSVYQTLKGIITSDEARIDVNPILLIDEYDIKAGHAATVGKIESEQLYYLQSRGLTQKEAEKLIINGLVKPVIDEISDEELKEEFINIVNKRI